MMEHTPIDQLTRQKTNPLIVILCKINHCTLTLRENLLSDNLKNLLSDNLIILSLNASSDNNKSLHK